MFPSPVSYTQPPPYLLFLLRHLGLEALSISHSPLQTQVLLHDGGLKLLQLRHPGLQLSLSRLLTEGQSGVNNVSDHMLWWNGTRHAFWEMKVWLANYRWSICSLSTAPIFLFFLNGSLTIIPFFLCLWFWVFWFSRQVHTGNNDQRGSTEKH